MSDRKRFALVIANGKYDNEGLSQLNAPTEDAQVLTELLEDPTIGYFDEVDLLIDEPFDIVSRAIAEFFSSRKRNELRLLYFSGHGLLDEDRRLFLAVRDTERKPHLLAVTAIPASFITDQMDHNRAKRQVLVLDCCHSGAFEITGAKASDVVGTLVETKQAFAGREARGRIVLTATDSVQYAWEGDRFIGESKHSLFTHYLVQGLRTGEADRHGNGEITTQEWFDYAYEYIVDETDGQQTPCRWAYRQEGDFIIAKNPQASVIKEAVNTRYLPDEGPFTGREEDLAALQALLANKKLVILEGLSGIGKTALALHYAYQAAGDYSATVWYEVQASDTLESVLVSVASQLSDAGYDALLDVVTDPQKNWKDRTTIFLDELRQVRVLLVLDAFNHCLDDSHRPNREFEPLLEGLLIKKYSSRVLLTSKVRARLNPTHSGKYGLYELRGLEAAAAVPLFLSLCGEVGHEVTRDEATAVCRAADGHPFALKIIVGLLHQGYLLEELLDQMRGRVTEDYGQFLLNILYNRLSPAAQTLLEACTVYRRPVRQVAIKKLPADEKKIHELLPYFLLEVEPHSRRYFTHTIVREYAYDKLSRNEERRKKVHKAAGDYLATVTREPHRRRDDFQTVQRILEAQYHYREAQDEQGIVATSAYIADELKPLVRQFYREGKNELASQLYRAILSMDEQDAEMHYYYARVLEKQRGAPEEIERHYREAVKLLPHHIEMQMRCLVWLTRQGKHATAQRAFSDAIKQRGDWPGIYVPYAKALRSARRLDEAAAVLAEGIQRVPPERNLAALYVEYSQVLRAQGDLEQAAAVLAEGIQRVPPESGLVALYQEYSQVLRAQGDLEKAAAVLAEGIQRVPPERNLAVLYVEYSQVLRAQGDLEQAAAVLEEGIQRVPIDSVVALYQEYSQVLRAQGDLEKAAAVLEEGIQRVPPERNLAALYVEYSQVQRAQGDLAKAAAVLEEGSQRVPLECNLAALYVEYSQVQRAQGDLAKAAAVLEEGIQRVPPEYSLVSLYQEYSQVLRAQGRLEEATAILQEGSQRLPYDVKGALLCAQARVLFDQGELVEMANVLSEAIELTPQMSTSYAYLACLHWMQGNFATAQATFEQGAKIPEIYGKDAELVHHYYGAFLAQTEQTEQARQFIAQTYSLSPQSPEIDARLSVLSSVRPEGIWSIAPFTDDVQWQEMVS